MIGMKDNETSGKSFSTEIFCTNPFSGYICTPAWGISSIGRALAWHARGNRFDPGILHIGSLFKRLSVPNAFGKVSGSIPVFSTALKPREGLLSLCHFLFTYCTHQPGINIMSEVAVNHIFDCNNTTLEETYQLSPACRG